MIKQVEICDKCAKCGYEQNFFVVEGIDFENFETNKLIDFSTYSAFKNPCLNVCENCGYINFDLTENLEKFATFNKDNTKYNDGVIGIDAIFQQYVEKAPFTLKSIQALAKIFTLQKFSYNSFVSKNFRKKTEYFDKMISLHNQLISQISYACEIYLQLNKNNFVSCFYVEILADLGKKDQATSILNSLPLKDDLKDYLLECIEIGGNE